MSDEKNKNMPAFPGQWVATNSCGEQAVQECWVGLTKREYFAALAMQGLLVNAGSNGVSLLDDSVGEEAVLQADRLLEALAE